MGGFQFRNNRIGRFRFLPSIHFFLLIQFAKLRLAIGANAAKNYFVIYYNISCIGMVWGRSDVIRTKMNVFRLAAMDANQMIVRSGVGVVSGDRIGVNHATNKTFVC